MSFFGRTDTPAPTPQPSTVVAEPATVRACRDDYASASHGNSPAGHVTAQPHTLGRRT